MAEGPGIHVMVLYSPAPREVREWPVVLAPGSTVLQALQACGLPADFPDLDMQSAAVGVWGHKACLEQVLRESDRVEIYRPLQVDPKLSRRERFRKQGVRTAGLFASGKGGSKRGY